MTLDKILNFNSDSRLSGTCVASFKRDGDVATRSLGNISSASYAPNLESRNREVKICGRSELIDTITMKSQPTASIKITDIDRDNLSLVFQGEDQETINQAVLSSVTVDPYPSIGSTKDIFTITNSTSRVYDVTALVLTHGGSTLVEGTDYVIISKRLGTIRFLKTFNAEVSVEVSANAFNKTPLKIGAVSPKLGIVTLDYYALKPSIGEQCEPEITIEGACSIMTESVLELVIDQDTEVDVKVSFSGIPNLIDLRAED